MVVLVVFDNLDTWEQLVAATLEFIFDLVSRHVVFQLRECSGVISSLSNKKPQMVFWDFLESLGPLQRVALTLLWNRHSKAIILFSSFIFVWGIIPGSWLKARLLLNPLLEPTHIRYLLSAQSFVYKVWWDSVLHTFRCFIYVKSFCLNLRRLRLLLQLRWLAEHRRLLLEKFSPKLWGGSTWLLFSDWSDILFIEWDQGLGKWIDHWLQPLRLP